MAIGATSPQYNSLGPADRSKNVLESIR